MQESEIVDMYWNRNPYAIKVSIENYGALCYKVAYNILYQRQDAEECVNETWLKAWNAIPPQRPNSLKAFLLRITRNLSYDMVKLKCADKRGGGTISLVLDELVDCIPSRSSVESDYIMQELTASINSFLKTLSARDRDIFLRRYFFVEEISDISRVYSTSRNNISAILMRIRKKLRLHLSKEGFI